MKWSSQLVSWAATFYAARNLSPGDFGLVAMAMLAIGFARMVQEFGLDAVLVQDRSIVGERMSQLASLFILFGVALCVMYVAIATLVAEFFDEKRVAGIIMVLGVIFILDAMQIVPYARLQRELQFRRLALVAFAQVCVTSAVLGSAVALNLGVWALVFNQLAGELVVTFILLALAPYSLSRPKRWKSLLQPLLQGWRTLVSRFAWYAYSNADRILIGRVLGKDLLGSYGMAQTLSTQAQQELGAIINRVVPGIFSEVQQRRAELRRYFLLLTEGLTVISFPVAIGMALIADLAIPLLLGDQWTEAVVPLRWLCLYSVFLSAQMLVPHLLLWTGQFRANMWCSVLAGVTIPAVLFFGVQSGLRGVAMVWALAFPLVSLPAFYFAFRTIAIGPLAWIRSIWPGLASCAVMAVAVICVRLSMPEHLPTLNRLLTSVSIGALAYVGTITILFRDRLAAWRILIASIRR